MDLLKSFFEVQVSLFCFSSLIYGHDAEIQSLHETPGCENKTKPRGCPPAPRGSCVAVGCPFVSESFTVLSTLCSSLSSRRKLILVISAHALNRKQ